MTSAYESLISDLKIKLKNKNIKFQMLFKLINNQNYDKIIEIIDDKTIHTLVENIVTERERIGDNMENKLNDLLWLNKQLIQYGEEPQVSKTKALKLLKKKVFINIYDSEAEKYERRTTKQLLKRELREKAERRFPLWIAKKRITLRSFLININM